MITQAQRWKFFPAMRAAWLAHIELAGLPDNEEQMDAWYRDEMELACREAGVGEGVRSVKDLDPIAGFDAVMLHFAIIAGDHTAAAYFSTAVERRCRKVIKDQLATLGELEFRKLDWSYARGIAAHMELPLRLEECPAQMLLKVIQALDTHRRRILASRGELDTRKPGLGANRWNREYHYRAAK